MWPEFPIWLPAEWVTILVIRLGNVGGRQGWGKVMCGSVGTSQWRCQPAVRHLSIWYFGVQERDLGWRPRFGSISEECMTETIGIIKIAWGDVCSVHLASDTQHLRWQKR